MKLFERTQFMLNDLYKSVKSPTFITLHHIRFVNIIYIAIKAI